MSGRVHRRPAERGIDPLTPCLFRARCRSTVRGAQLRSDIEDLTDRLAYQPWQVLSDDDGAEVAEVASSIRAQVASAKLFPGGAFGPRYGQPR